MSKVLITADQHIHKHKNSERRLKDCIEVLEWIFTTAQKRNINDILFLGDLFHNRQKIDIQTYQWVFEIFDKYSGPNIYLLLGNHDLFHKLKHNITSVKPLGALPKVTIIDSPSTLEIADHLISFLPYTEDPATDIKLLDNDSNYKILCGHLAVDGAILNSVYQTTSDVQVEHDGDMTFVDTTVFDGWDQVFLGHYHGEQKLEPHIEYVGSPMQFSFGEAHQDKHIIEYDLETKEKKYIPNNFSPKHFIISQDELSKYELTDNFIRVEVDDIGATDLVEVKKDVYETATPGSFEFKPKKKSKADDSKIVDEALDNLNFSNLNEMLEKYVEIMDDNGLAENLDHKKLISVGKELMQKNSSE
jgi:DNA repair exonuclease SbcCD nuclease subunit